MLQVMADGLGELGRLVDEGKIRHIGVSNETVWGMSQFLKLSEAKGLPRLASVQNEYNLIRRHFDQDHAELCHHEGVGLLAYSPLAAGVLTGKYLDGAVPAGSRGSLSAGHVAAERVLDARDQSLPRGREEARPRRRADGDRLRAHPPVHGLGDHRRHQPRSAQDRTSPRQT